MERGGPRRSRPAGTSIEPRVDEQIIRLFDDPHIYELFGAVATRVVETTPSALSEYVGLPRAQVEQRLSALEQCDMVEPVAGTDAHEEPTYRTTRDALITDEEWSAFTPAHRRRLFTAALRNIDRRLWSAVERGGFDAQDTHVSWTPLDLDQEGYQAMVELALEMLERARDIQASVVQRRAGGADPTDSVTTDLMILHFRRSAEATDDAGVADIAPLREELYRGTEDLADGVAAEDLDAEQLAGRAQELMILLQRLAAVRAAT